ncbi:uroporphyrinogen decarboxylase [Pullulanibacillus pueri]|uniref:Uroporphyrinogen decarboxylase n=1 Tax=Pullulanibacillus pueri TaxID=1437324 RepID=A0A8J3ENS0_9BACL|nr:uroporphyrinogen decarboxylase [Pullulanibacillus pueri]MBM7683441.1 uroporphyrinogen decarboxylase [Pullulanibacillus pueri]GGH87414.1 uroporphyrinogen decarboxylase [Pullulanibacillus pueri]
MGQKPFNDTFLKACRREEVPYTPVWYMRQAGRYQPEYREIRKQYSFFEINDNPEVCAKVTRLPVEQLGVDAAILFADIMTPLKPIGVDVDIVPGKGPMIGNPIRTVADVNRLRAIAPQRDLPFIGDTIQLLREQLSVPLIGFAGAPFTLSSYLIEGGPSKDYHKTKGFMYAYPEEWQALMDKLADVTIDYLTYQIASGAQAVQVFDSWIGSVGADDYEAYIAPTMEKIFTALKATGVPTIYFGSGAAHLLPIWNHLPVDVLSIDWRIDIQAARALGIEKALQGNLDPSTLLAPWEFLEKKAKAILDQGMAQPGYIFNLGHGVFPEANVSQLQRLTKFIHDYTKK